MTEKRTRVWQWTEITFEVADKAMNNNRTIIPVNPPPKICTYTRDMNRQTGEVAVCKTVIPNAAFQYVIHSMDTFYDEQCKAMQYRVDNTFKGKLIEITDEPDLRIGVIPKKFRPQPPKSAREEVLESEVAKLHKQLEELRSKEKK